LRNAFGTLIASPEQLPREQRIGVVREIAGRLLADRAIEARWLGAALSAWLRDGGDLAAALGIKAPRGSHATPQQALKRDMQDAALATLVVAAGGVVAAAALNGEPCSGLARAALDRAVALRCPRSRTAVGRAVARHRQ
jgi:hypothetical protein